MRLWFAGKWEDIRDSFWFVPTLMVLAAIGLSWIMIQADKSSTGQAWVGDLGWTFSRGPEGSRAVLSTIAASMMTIASVIFSITIVALQLASSQFGPRILRNFMRDRGNQVAIGTFIATFTYCLLILRTVNGIEEERFVPHLSVTIGLLLALVSLGVFIFFIHHTAESIQADQVITAVSRELHHAIEKLYPTVEGKSDSDALRGRGDDQLPDSFEVNAHPIRSVKSGYLQAMDIEALLAHAVDKDVLLSTLQRPGDFCLKGEILVLKWPPEASDDGSDNVIQSCFNFGARRSLAQDIEFSIKQLVEIAVRALSPGINDPFTAINCVDRLGEALHTLADREFPPTHQYDDEGKLRVIVDVSTMDGIVDTTFNQIRQAARTDASVTLRLLEMIAAVARQTVKASLLNALRRQAEAIHYGSREGLEDPSDREDADVRFQNALHFLSQAPASQQLDASR